MKILRTIAKIIFAAALTSTSYGGIVSLNFSKFGNAPTNNSASASVGAAKASFWNDTFLDPTANTGASQPTIPNDSMSNLRDSNGAASTVSISWSSGGLYSITGSVPGADADGTWNRRVINGYLNSASGLGTSSTTLNITGVSYPSYDIYVYFSSDVAGRAGNVTNGTTTYYFNTYGPGSLNHSSGNAMFGRALATNSGSAAAANFAVFSNRSGSTQQIVTSIPQGGGIAAIQVVQSTQRGRPQLNAERTTFVSDQGTMLRGPIGGWLSLSDYTKSYNALAKLKTLGFNSLHYYAEGFDANYPAPGSKVPGHNMANMDAVVAATRELGLYLVLTIGGEGGFNRQYTLDFWQIYAPRYANEAHVIYEIQNEPVSWSPPYVTSQNPSGALELQVDAYNLIRQHAPDTAVLLFSYSQVSGSGNAGTSGALMDIRAFNQAIYGTQEAVWDNIAVAFHGYGGSAATTVAVEGILAAGYPSIMTEFYTSRWGSAEDGIDVALTADLERLKVSWLTFCNMEWHPWNIPDVTAPYVFVDRVNRSGLGWTPDFGTWPSYRATFGNNGYAWTTPGYTNNTLTGTLRIEAENFDAGGKNVAYFNANTSNPGGQYRTNETVGIKATTDTGAGYFVGWTAAGNWLDYTIKVPAAGYYNLRLRVAGPSIGSVQLSAGDDDLTGQWTLPNTGGWQTWTTVTKSVFLGLGQHKMRVNMLSGGFNLNWIELSPATTGPVANGTYKLLNAGSNLALTIDTANQGTVVAPASSARQQWTVHHIGGGQYKVTSVDTGGLWNTGFQWWTWSSPLRAEGSWSANGDRCYLFLPGSNGNFRLVTAGGGRSLQPTSATPPAILPQVDTGAIGQQWSMVSETPLAGAVASGTYRIVARHSGKALAAFGAQTANGTQIVQSTSTGANNQLWTVTALGDGKYSIIGVQSGRSLDVNNWGTANGTAILLWSYAGGTNQKFELTLTGNGFYRVTPACAPNSCLSVEGISTADNAAVHLWQSNAGYNQQWSFEAP